MVEWEPVIISVTLFVVGGGVLILRPIAKHLGAYLEALTRRQLEPGRSDEMQQLREFMELADQRLRLLEERQDFSERLLGQRNQEQLSDE